MLYIVATSPHRRTISVLWRSATVFSLGAQLAKPFKSQKEQFLMHSISYTLHGDFHSEVLRENLISPSLCKVYRRCFIFLLVSIVATRGGKKEPGVWATCYTCWCWTNNSICWSKRRRWKPQSLTVIESFPGIRYYNIICFSSFI